MMVGVENNSMTHRKIKRDVKQSQLWIGKYELTKRKSTQYDRASIRTRTLSNWRNNHSNK